MNILFKGTQLLILFGEKPTIIFLHFILFEKASNIKLGSVSLRLDVYKIFTRIKTLVNLLTSKTEMFNI